MIDRMRIVSGDYALLLARTGTCNDRKKELVAFRDKQVSPRDYERSLMPFRDVYILALAWISLEQYNFIYLSKIISN